MLKRLISCITIFLLLVFAMPIIHISADKTAFDVVFVIDNSGSMRASDKERLALSGSMMLIDLLSGTNSRAGYVMFSDRILDKRSLEVINGNTALIDALKSTEYPDIGATDIGFAMSEGFSLFENTGNKKVVILLSDGKPEAKGKTANELYSAISTQTQRFKDENIPVYTIGLNNDGSVDIANMKSIAMETNGGFYEVNKNTDLADCFIDIFVSLRNAKISRMQTTDNTGVSVLINENIEEIAVINIGTKPLATINAYDGDTKIPVNSTLKAEEKYTYMRLDNKGIENFKVTEENAFINIITIPKEIKNYTVTFINDDKTNEVLIAENSPVTEPSVSTKTDYKFLGWFLEEEKFDFSKPVNADITLTAKWEYLIVPHTVFFIGRSNNNSADMSIEVEYGGKLPEINFPITADTVGYSLDGWFTDSTFNNEFDSNTPIFDNITLYGKFTPISVNPTSAIILFILALLSAAFSFLIFPKIMDSKLFNMPPLVSSIFTVITNTLICLSMLFLFNDVISLKVMNFAIPKNDFFGKKYFEVYMLYYFYTAIVGGFVFNFIFAYIVPAFTSTMMKVKHWQFITFMFISLIGIVFPLYFWYVCGFGVKIFAFLLIPYFVAYPVNFLISSLAVRATYAKHFRFII